MDFHDNAAIIVFLFSISKKQFCTFMEQIRIMIYNLCPKTKYFTIEDYSGILMQNKLHRGYLID